MEDEAAFEICALTALEIVDRFSAGQISATAVVEAFLERIDRFRDLNACVLIDLAQALAQARLIDRARADGKRRGRLAAVPFLVKDNIEVGRQPCAAGTPGLRSNVASATAPTAAALLAEGAILLGRSNMHELALGITSGNVTFGIARNPYNRNLIPGGSSGGAAAALAARLVPLALGTDTGASVRAPASFCGVAALRPSVGEGGGERRYPLTGVVPLSPTRDTVGPMARNLADVALADAAITGASALPRIALDRIRLGVPRRSHWQTLDDDVRRVCERALGAIEAAGAILIEAEIEALDALGAGTSLAVTLFEFAPALGRYLDERGGRIAYADVAASIAGSDVRVLEMLARSVSAVDYANARDIALPALRLGFRHYFAANRLDGYIFPTVPIAAPPIDEAATGDVEINGVRQPGGPAALFATVIRNLDASSLAGIPSVTFPAGMTLMGLPVGLGIDGPVGSDRRLLAIGIVLETLLGGVPPPEGYEPRSEVPGVPVPVDGRASGRQAR